MSLAYRILRPVGLLLTLCLAAGVVAAGMTFPGVAGLGLVSNDAGDSVNAVSADLSDGPLPQATTITDSTGVPIARFFEENQNRRSVPPEGIAPAMKAAIVAIEDRRFYQHNGVDWQGTIRAVVTNSTSGEIQQGASTITQQYVKNYLLYVDAQTLTEKLQATEQTPARKLKEAQIALQMERTLSKEEILTRYLNVVSFGNGASGISAAARTYFNTTADQLTVPQAAMLAGLVQSTTKNDPVTRPEESLDRRDTVIRAMREQAMIDDTQMQAALDSPLGVVNPLVTQSNGCIGAGDAGFFCQYVYDYLREAGFSEEQIERGGYTITTTLDRNALQKMQASLLNEVPAQQPDVANVMAIVAPGADKHRVLAMGSSRVYGFDQAAEQTSYGLPYEQIGPGVGSIYKIFTAATALDKGLGIDYQLEVPPGPYLSPIYLGTNRQPVPLNNSRAYPARMTMTDALAQSPNTAFVKLMEYTGVPPVVDMAVKLGLKSLDTVIDTRTGRTFGEDVRLGKQSSFTLGVTPTSVLELANVGATLASGGMWCPPSPIETMVDPDGNPVPLTEAPCDQGVEPGLAGAVLAGLSKDHVPGGTAGGAASAFNWRRPMAGKTGTTQNNKSAAFIGVVPQYSGAVITYDNTNEPQPLCDGNGAPFACDNGNIFGGKTPALTWFGTMTPLLENQPVLDLPPVEDRYRQGDAAVRVPEVIGDGENEARRRLEDGGWKVSRTSVPNAASRGTVVGQSPRGMALPGENVTLSVSSGSVPAAPPPPGEGRPAAGDQGGEQPGDQGGDQGGDG